MSSSPRSISCASLGFKAIFAVLIRGTVCVTADNLDDPDWLVGGLIRADLAAFGASHGLITPRPYSPGMFSHETPASAQ